MPLNGCEKPDNSGKRILNSGLATNSVTLPACRANDPFTKSALSANSGAQRFSIVRGEYGSISASKKTRISLVAISTPSFMEVPLPRFWLMITFAPASDASLTVASMERSSTTITSDTCGEARANLTTLPIVASSFKAGIMTVICFWVFIIDWLIRVWFVIINWLLPTGIANFLIYSHEIGHWDLEAEVGTVFFVPANIFLKSSSLGSNAAPFRA